jgi:hypothetical protein
MEETGFVIRLCAVGKGRCGTCGSQTFTHDAPTEYETPAAAMAAVSRREHEAGQHNQVWLGFQ